MKLNGSLTKEPIPGYTADFQNEDFIACLAFFAHEARNPLAVISDSVYCLRLTGDPAQTVVDTYDRIDRQVGILKRLIGDLAEFSAGNLELRSEPTDLSRIWSAALELASPLLESKGQTLVGEVTSGTKLHVDGMRLSQVFANILTNASKFTPSKGKIHVSSKQKNSFVEITIRDEGIGINAEDLKWIFELYFRGDDSRLNQRPSGMGIGLAIAKRIVELHGGSISAHSDGNGMGSEFVVCLPLLPAAKPSSII